MCRSGRRAWGPGCDPSAAGDGAWWPVPVAVVVLALGRLGRLILGELLAQVVLGLGGVDAGAPQLVHDEQQDQDTGPDHEPPHARRCTRANRHAGTIVSRCLATGSPGDAVVGPAALVGVDAPPVPSGHRHGARRPPPRRGLAPGPLPGARRRRSRRRPGRDRAAPGPERGRQDAPCCARWPACCPVVAGTAEVLGHDLRRDRRVGAAPGRPAGPRHHALRRAHGGRQRALLGPGRRRRPGRRRGGPGGAGPRRTAARRGRGPAVGRPAPAGRHRRAGGPPPRAVAARRAPRRPRRRGPRHRRRARPRARAAPGPPCVVASHELERATPWPAGSSPSPAGSSKARR